MTWARARSSRSSYPRSCLTTTTDKELYISGKLGVAPVETAIGKARQGNNEKNGENKRRQTGEG